MPAKQKDPKPKDVKTSDEIKTLRKELDTLQKLRKAVKRERRAFALERFKGIRRRGVIRPDWLYTLDEVAATLGVEQARTARAKLEARGACRDEFTRNCVLYLGRWIIEAVEEHGRCPKSGSPGSRNGVSESGLPVG